MQRTVDGRISEVDGLLREFRIEAAAGHQRENRRERNKFERRKLPVVVGEFPEGGDVDDFDPSVPGGAEVFPKFDRPGEGGLRMHVAAACRRRRQVATPVSGGLNAGAEGGVEPDGTVAGELNDGPAVFALDLLRTALEDHLERNAAAMVGKIDFPVVAAPEEHPVAAEFAVAFPVVDDTVAQRL